MTASPEWLLAISRTSTLTLPRSIVSSPLTPSSGLLSGIASRSTPYSASRMSARKALPSPLRPVSIAVVAPVHRRHRLRRRLAGSRAHRHGLEVDEPEPVVGVAVGDDRVAGRPKIARAKRLLELERMPVRAAGIEHERAARGGDDADDRPVEGGVGRRPVELVVEAVQVGGHGSPAIDTSVSRAFMTAALDAPASTRPRSQRGPVAS